MSQSEKQNLAQKPSLEEVISSRIRLGRRQILGGGLGLAAGGLIGGLLSNCGKKSEGPEQGPLDPDAALAPNAASLRRGETLLGFTSVAAILDQSFDAVRVPEGYRAEAFYAWGDPLVSGATPARADASDDAAAQELQAGQSHDGMIFFPRPGDPDRGLLCINHEDIEPATLHPSGQTWDAARRRPRSEVEKEVAAMGISVLAIKRQAGTSRWERERDSPLNRRITAATPIELSGPARGHPLLATAADPAAQRVLGTMNNCAAGQTPWGTYLTCEENFNKYFANRAADDLKRRREHSRYGILEKSEAGWDSVLERFDLTPQPGQAHGGYVNEANRFGWVVEIDPFDPLSTPKKRTALGRFAHENVATFHARDGRLAFYMGDDSRGEYIYKFTPRDRYQPQTQKNPSPAQQQSPLASRGDLLDHGTLHVAVFYDDGSGEWIELQHGRHGLTALNGFRDQAEVLVNTRSAADHVGATPMDRPEWITVHPSEHDIYVSLTNNTKRGKDEERQELNAANPRANNIFGHIIRIREEKADPHARRFNWDFYVQAGDPQHPEAGQRGDIKGDIFGSPDGLWFDKLGRLWVETDFDDSDPHYQSHIGLNMLMASDPATREFRRFLVGPKGCEITGITSDRELKTLWVNIQHPTLSFPASDGTSRPRSTTVMITKDDGGTIGS